MLRERAPWPSRAAHTCPQHAAPGEAVQRCSLPRVDCREDCQVIFRFGMVVTLYHRPPFWLETYGSTDQSATDHASSVDHTMMRMNEWDDHTILWRRFFSSASQCSSRCAGSTCAAAAVRTRSSSGCRRAGRGAHIRPYRPRCGRRPRDQSTVLAAHRLLLTPAARKRLGGDALSKTGLS